MINNQHGNQYPRFRLNKNLHVVNDDNYQGFSIISSKRPFIKEWLDVTIDTTYLSLQQYPRVTIIRFDLRLPDYVPYFDDGYTGLAFQRFIDSLKAKVKHSRAMAFKQSDRVNDTVVRYIACTEYENDGKPHIHMALFLNGDAYRYLGWLGSAEKNLAKMISSAWCSALNLPWEEEKGLVYFPSHCVYRINRNRESYADAIYRLSYLCKIKSKRFGIGLHPFNHSHTKPSQTDKISHTAIKAT